MAEPIRLARGVERLEVNIVEKRLRNVGFVVISSADGGAVPGKMFHASQNVIGRADVVALKTADLRDRHRRSRDTDLHLRLPPCGPSADREQCPAWAQTPI